MINDFLNNPQVSWLIEFILQPNILTGGPAIVMGCLLMIAFRNYAFVMVQRHVASSVSYLGAALFWLAARSVGRSVWWDFFGGFGLGNASNWIWNLMGILACYCALKGFHLLLPTSERWRYTIWTVAFYPRRIWRRLHDENEG